MAEGAFVTSGRAGARPTRLRLANDDAELLRFTFCDLERVAGVKSSHEDQIAALSREHGDMKRSDRVVAWLEGRGLKYSERGFSKVNARPMQSGCSARFPMRMVQLEGDRVDPEPVRVSWAPQDEWVCRAPVKLREGVRRAWLTLRELAPKSPRLLSVLWKVYGPRDPNADYTTFGAEIAPLVHLTATAEGLAERATLRAREEDSRELARRDLEASLAGREEVPDLRERVECTVAEAAARSHVWVEPRHATDAELRRLRGAIEGKGADGAPDAETRARLRGDLTELTTTLKLEAERLLIRATTAYLRTREGLS
jgi:hypothetical protein